MTLKRIIGLFGLGLLLAVVLFLVRRPRSESPSLATQPSRSNASVPAPLIQPTPTSVTPGAVASNPTRPTSLSDQIIAAADTLKGAKDTTAARQSLAQLNATLAAAPPAEASAAIRQVLDSKADATTGMGFSLDGNGFLKEYPSLRLFLLDYLAQVDLPAAGAYAEKILASMDSPDEWALSLRNYAKANPAPEARAFLRQKLEQMFHHEPWQSNPSTGYLEAFDTAVYAGGTELLPSITELLRKKDNQAVAHASYLAMDRMVLQEPASVLAELQRRPELMEGREPTRANYFARADVGDPQQKQILEQYLLNPKVTASELDTFAGIFPNGNYMISHNLLTKNVTPDRATQARGDRAALDTVNNWLADPRFEKIKPQLQKLKSRLELFVK